MAKVLIPYAAAESLRTGDKSLKKVAWAGVRQHLSSLGFDVSDVKLGVECDPDRPNYRAVYVKGSDPREYFNTADTGNPPQVQPREFVAVSAPDDGTSWVRITKADFIDMMQEADVDPSDYASNIADDKLPPGFPVHLPAHSIVMDPRTGDIYVRL